MTQEFFSLNGLKALLRIHNRHFKGRKMEKKMQDIAKKSPTFLGGRAFDDWSGGDLLSHANAHYHRRKPVSRSCSGWEGVVPGCYSRQVDGKPQRYFAAANKGGRNKAIWEEIAPSAKI